MGKIIDQKGRIFGTINVIDLSVILVLLSFIPIVFIGYKVILGGKAEDTKWVSVRIKLTEIDPEFSDVISKGDVEKDSFGKTIGKLASISSVKASKVWVIADNKMLTTIDHPVKKDILVDADILCTRQGRIFYYKSVPVKIGSTIIFATDLYNLSGLIIGLKVDVKN